MKRSPAQDKSADRPTIFLSYAREDREFVRRLSDALTASGIDVRADWQLTPGEQFERSLRSSILIADAFLFIISPDSIASPECKKEIATAVEHKKRILPICYRPHGDDNALDSALRSPQWTFLRDGDDFNAGVTGLVNAVHTDFDLMDLHSRLLVAVEDWNANGRDRSYLLGKEGLKKAEDWLTRTSARPEKLPQPTAGELEFIFASQAARTRATRITAAITAIVTAVIVLFAAIAIQKGIQATRNGAEAVRQGELAKQNASVAIRNEAEAKRQEGLARANEREARIQQQLAEERRAEADEQRRVATEQRDRAMSRALAAGAMMQLSPSSPLGMLLATEAARTSPTEEAENALRESLVAARQVPAEAAGPLYTVGKSQTAVSPDGKVMLAGGGPTATLRSVDGNKVVRELRGHADDIDVVAFSPDGRFAVTGSQDRTARIWDVRRGVSLAILIQPTRPASVAFTRDGNYVVISAAGSVSAWETKTGQAAAELPQADAPVDDVSFSPDGRWLATRTRTRQARIWDVQHRAPVDEIRGELAIFSPDGRTVLTATGNTATLWDIEQRRKAGELRAHSGRIRAAAFSPNGKSIVTCSDDRTAVIWPARGDRPLAELRGHSAAVTAAAFSPDSSRVATASDDDTVRIWNVADGRTLVELRGHKSSVLSVAFNRRGDSLLTASDDGTARLWDVASGQLRRTFNHGDEGVKTAFSPDGTVVATGSEMVYAGMGEQTTAPVILWDAATGRTLATLRGHLEVITSVAFSPNGRWLLSASQDETARIWDVKSARPIMEMRRHSGGVRKAVFAPNGKDLVTASGDGRTLFYRCDLCGSLDDLVALAKARAGRQLTADERRKYLQETR